ncbi:hypothetical protein FOS14_06935 [Skermania sp. ID1734]|uniref:flagellar motor control protein ZomB n=1 Tax=Skermania sp. ID1734 TaxID=2597516 RepID=UPI00117C3177|nr:flagellar motor control protein ZomB [Skermania sp. ID1734]TSE00744.1 hypothetical protein FOS14_06935 [Skermania sp. ID1734]
MSLSTSREELTAEFSEVAVDKGRVRYRYPNRVTSWVVFVVGIAITGGFFCYGGWERRWIADDGLIVLRTVRNLLAGNGPVFNIGERVETNTSTAWTYLIYALSWVTQARIEYVVLGLALTLSVSAIVLAMLGAGKLWGGPRSGFVLLPAGAIVYIAVPPARDYATSGLEISLEIFWLALVWFLMMRWSKLERSGAATVLPLCFLLGLGPLVRPEMTIFAVVSLAFLFFTPMHNPVRTRIAMVLIAGAVPVGYQIWRMGYYALPYPNTAVAKDAVGSKWGQGFTYLWNLVGPYVLWLPLALLVVVTVLVLRRRAGAPADVVATATPKQPVWRRLQRRLRTPGAVVALFLVCGLLLTGYTIKVGGDFMHGRMLLPQLFCFLLPVSVIAIRVPEDWRSRSETTGFALAGIGWIATIGWAIFASNTVGMPNGTVIGRSGIVDERAYYVLNTGHAHPILAEDYLDYPRMRAMLRDINETPNGGLLLASPSFEFWDVAPPPLPIPPGGAGHTVYFLNLGMTSMNVPLDVRVIDQEGLAYPLAAHTVRLKDGRIGHDKDLYPDWVIADLHMVDKHPWMPWYLDEDWVKQAEVALKCPETEDLLTSYRSDLTWARWKQNFRRSLEFAKYRFDRVPKYEIQRCDLPKPKLQRGY